MYDCRYWLWLSLIFEPGSTRCDALLHAFGNDPKAIYEASQTEYEPLCNNNLRLINALCDKSLDRVYNVLDFCKKNNIGILTLDDPKYPTSLLRIQGHPPVIYYKGTIPDFSKNLTVAIVGTRSVSAYGSSAAYTLAHDLAVSGVIVVSGMALGSDTAAHRGALDAKGTTVAFLGCGIDRVYPKENERLMNEIIANGAVMTDYPPGARPEGRHFPIRNRLISGVSHGVLVIEAAKKSGALITAEHALRQGKLLYAIPGRIGELASEGTNGLLLDGAKTVTKAGDILCDFEGLFKFEKYVSRSGFVQYKKSQPEELREPYQTPTYNPYANSTNTYIGKSNRSEIYNFVTPPRDQQPAAQQSPKKEQAAPSIVIHTNAQKRATPMYSDLGKIPYYGASGYQNNQKMNFSDPKPRIIFSEFDDEEHAKAFMSLTDEEKAELESIDMLAHRPTLKYRTDPIPPGGYTVELTPEKIKKFEAIDQEVEIHKASSFDDSIFKAQTPMKNVINSFEELAKLHEQDMKRHEERQKLREEAKAKGIQDYTGLSNVEIKVLKLLEPGIPLSVESMSGVGIPLNNLLSVLTVLEIKHRVIQHPGGYFEINKDY